MLGDGIHLPLKRYNDRFKLQPKEQLVIILDELDFSWFPGEIEQALAFWDAGMSLPEMAERLRPGRGDDGQYEVMLLLLHLARQEKIAPRPGGIWGMCNE